VLDGARHFDIGVIIISEVNDQQVVYLQEVGVDQWIPILIGILEATWLDRRIKGVPTPRPLAHDATAMIIRDLGAAVQDVVVDSLAEHTYRAKLRIRHGFRLLVEDLRPSDAFALALVFGAPIFFTDEICELLWQAEH
jgi:hypothetical protein